MSKDINSFKQVKDRILLGLNTLADPVRQTLTPKGSNTIFEDGVNVRITNDGITIANSIEVEDPVANSIIQIVRQAGLRTNALVGDGTTTSILLAQSLITEGFKLIDAGWNPMTLKRTLLKAGNILVDHIKSQVKKIKTREDLEFIANVSANNDIEIARNTVEAVTIAGEDGLCVIEDNPVATTELKKEEGYFMETGMFSPLFANQKNRMEAHYKDIKVLVTDKRIYSPNEVLAVLEPLAKAGIHEAVIVARDFIGQAPNIFITNHLQKRMNILLVRDSEATDKNTESLEDLAAYLGTNVISDKAGKLTFNVSLEDYGTAKRVMSYSDRTLFYNYNQGIELKMRVQTLKNEITKIKLEENQKPLKKRLARMTKGTVTILVGGRTPVEVRDTMYRYEDAVNATRSAIKDGYVIGGGLTLWNAYNEAKPTLKEEIPSDVISLLGIVSRAPLKQIAENCDIDFNLLILKVEANKGRTGYNAVTEKYEVLEKAGIIEPLLVLQLAFENALSVAAMILSSSFIITQKPEDENNLEVPKRKKKRVSGSQD